MMILYNKELVNRKFKYKQTKKYPIIGHVIFSITVVQHEHNDNASMQMESMGL